MSKNENELDKIKKSEKFQRRIKNGSLVLVKNSNRDIDPIAIGEGVKIKINANIGTTSHITGYEIDEEIKKAETAVKFGADTIMDLSIGGQNLGEIRRKILNKTNVPLGTVPIYQAFLEKKTYMTSETILKVIEKHCKDGVDFLTLHCGITKDIVKMFDERLIPITSRGGSFLSSWMLKNKGCENPLYVKFPEILEIVKEYGVVISLGDALRPACLHDSSDYLQFQELMNLGRLTKIARKEGVPVIIEGPGHIPLNEIEMNVKLEKKICDNSPFYVLGPLPTDTGLGYDHITGAIGGAIAGMHGADFLCYVTPSEHLSLPSIEDVKNGVIASKIAAHSADIVRLKNHVFDDEFSRARKNLDWGEMFRLCKNDDVKEKYKHLLENKNDPCSMCGEYCALKNY